MKKNISILLILIMCGGSDDVILTIEDTTTTTVADTTTTTIQDSNTNTESQDTTTTTVADTTTTTIQDSNTNTESQDSNTCTESSTSDSSSSNNIIWGKVTSCFEVYAAPDVTQQHIDVSVEWFNKGIELWGNYGPAELWIVGKSNDGARALDDIWCDVRVEKDPTWNTKWDCLNGDPYGSGDGWSPFYRCPDEGCSSVSTYIRESLGYYFSAMTMSTKYPGPEEDDYKKVILHEYFHIYQAAQISQPEIDDGDGDWMTSNRNYIETGDYVQRPWITEGGAEYMATYWYSKQSGVSEGYFEERMRWKAESLPGYLSDGRSMREVGYDNNSWNIYDVGTWFVAYIINQTSEETFRVDFYSELEELGFEAAFEKHFGKSADAMIEEFNAWASQPVDVLVEILP